MGGMIIAAPIKDNQFVLWGEKYELEQHADLIGLDVTYRGQKVGKVVRGTINRKLKRVEIELFLTGVDGHRNRKLKIIKPAAPNPFSLHDRFMR